MEDSKTEYRNDTQSNSKIVKVVNLKRFMPKTDACMFKRKICLSNFRSKSPNICKEVDIKKVVSDVATKVENTLESCTEVMSCDVEDNSSSYKTKFPDNQKSKIKFRSCSHSMEELTRLTEHTNETLVKVGDIFESREAFRKYVNNNAKDWFYYYVCRTSKKNVLEYNCICMAYTLKPKDTIIRKQKKRTTACPCKVRLTIDDDSQKVTVYYVCNHHDHELSKDAFYNYPHAKYLPQDVKDVFLDLVYMGLDVDLIQKYIHSLVGLTIKRKDISSYAYKSKRNLFERNLTPERTDYIKNLITKIQDTYKESILQYSEKDGEIFDATTVGNKPKRAKRRKSQSNAKVQKSCLDATENQDSMGYMDPGDSLLDNMLHPNTDENYDVIVQYINEEGILCDKNGTPVTNSSAIMQFINSYEHIMTDSDAREGFLEERTVFNELAENISDDIYPLDWSAEETKPLVEQLDDPDLKPNVETVEDAVVDVRKDVEVGKTSDCEPIANNSSSIIVHSDVIVKCDKRLSPSRESPAAYAQMDNFRKYYFVDHRYIKREDEDSTDHRMKLAIERMKRRARMTMWANENCEEYIKAPKYDQYPSPLRGCSGHGDLTPLSDPDAILPGARFRTHEVFLNYINERANRWFFYYSLVESGKLPEYYVYKCLFGKYRVSRNAYRAKGLRKRSKLTTQCPCQIRLRRLYTDPSYLTVLYSCNHHDHALNDQLFNTQPHSRRLPAHVKEEIKDLLSIGATFDVLRKYVMLETGHRVYGKYFHNVRARMAKVGEARHFTEERFEVLSQKLKNLNAMCSNASEEKSQEPTHQPSGDLRASSSQDVSLTLADASPPLVSRKRSRLETRLQNLSSHEETLLKVKKLQESVRADHLRHHTYEIVQHSSIVRTNSSTFEDTVDIV